MDAGGLDFYWTCIKFNDFYVSLSKTLHLALELTVFRPLFVPHKNKTATQVSVLRFVVVPPGFEPRLTEPKPGVLPLHHGTIIEVLHFKSGAKITLFFVFSKLIL